MTAKIFEKRTCLTSTEIDEYLNGKMKDDNIFDLENHLLDCQLCSAAVDGFANLDHSKAQEQLADIAKELNLEPLDIGDKPETKVRKLSPTINWLAIAASIAFLVFSGILYQSNQSTPDRSLFAQNYEPYDSPFGGARSGPKVTTDLDLGLIAYHKKEYDVALKHFASQINIADPTFVAQFHSGLIYLERGEAEKALEFLKATRINVPAIYGEATWYLAMAHLKLNQIQECKELLSQIKVDDRIFHRKAQELLAQLKN